MELTIKHEREKKIGNFNEVILQGECLAIQGKYNDAANLYDKAGMNDKAVELFTELKRWDDAKSINLIIRICKKSIQSLNLLLKCNGLNRIRQRL